MTGMRAERKRHAARHIPLILAALSVRPRQIAVLWHRGLSRQAIADELEISPKTVDRNVGDIYSELEVSSRAEFHDEIEDRLWGRP